MTRGSMAWTEIQTTPRRVLLNLVDYLTQRRGYKPRPVPGIMDLGGMPPAAFREAMAQQGRRRLENRERSPKT